MIITFFFLIIKNILKILYLFIYKYLFIYHRTLGGKVSFNTVTNAEVLKFQILIVSSLDDVASKVLSLLIAISKITPFYNIFF